MQASLTPTHTQPLYMHEYVCERATIPQKGRRKERKNTAPAPERWRAVRHLPRNKCRLSTYGFPGFRLAWREIINTMLPSCLFLRVSAPLPPFFYPAFKFPSVDEVRLPAWSYCVQVCGRENEVLVRPRKKQSQPEGGQGTDLHSARTLT